MRDNPVKARLAAGGKAFGTMVFEFSSPGLPALLAAAGAEFALYDMEHSGFGMEEMKRQFSYGRGIGLVPIVRPPEKSYSAVSRLLDMGAMGLMFQMVETPEEAERIVSWTRYPPEGVRGAMFGGAHDDYAPGDLGAKMAKAHERTFVMCMIETKRGLEAVDEIAAVPGVDALHLGQFVKRALAVLPLGPEPHADAGRGPPGPRAPGPRPWSQNPNPNPRRAGGWVNPNPRLGVDPQLAGQLARLPELQPVPPRAVFAPTRAGCRLLGPAERGRRPPGLSALFCSLAAGRRLCGRGRCGAPGCAAALAPGRARNCRAPALRRPPQTSRARRSSPTIHSRCIVAAGHACASHAVQQTPAGAKKTVKDI